MTPRRTALAGLGLALGCWAAWQAWFAWPADAAWLVLMSLCR